MSGPERAFHPVRPRDAAVRPLPLPFRGALAISNDAEYLRRDFLDSLMAYLNTRQMTPWGRGLGLRVTTSAFFFSAPDYNLTYFAGTDAAARRSEHAARMELYLRAGWMDTIHAYGDFDGAGGCTRAHAEAVFGELERMGLHLEVFTNHGSTANTQNVGRDAAYHGGDVRTHPSYHADLLDRHGVRYVWTDSLVHPVARGPGLRAALWRWRHPEPKTTLVPLRLQDGREFLGFQRLRGTGENAPNLSSFGRQMDRIDFTLMYAEHGAVVVYQHLGVLERVAGRCTAATVAAVSADPERFLGGFQRLAAEQARGKLWVAGAAELLRYLEMVHEVSVRESASPDETEVCFPRPVRDPGEFFAGLTVAVRAGAKGLVHAGRPLPAHRRCDPDNPALEWFTVPRQVWAEIW